MTSKKLLMSKWTAAQPVNKEKHFLVTDLIKDDQGNCIHCLLEAVYSGKIYQLDPHELKDRRQWLPGWQRAEPLVE